MEICLYCQKGKAINISEFGDISIKTYIHGNLLVTEAINYRNDKDDFSAMRINVCPVCKKELEERFRKKLWKRKSRREFRRNHGKENTGCHMRKQNNLV